MINDINPNLDSLAFGLPSIPNLVS